MTYDAHSHEILHVNVIQASDLLGRTIPAGPCFVGTGDSMPGSQARKFVSKLTLGFLRDRSVWIPCPRFGVARLRPGQRMR